MANPLAQQCKAVSKQSGEQCKNWARHGTTVCKFHGGNAPQTLAKAKERLLIAVNPAMAKMIELAKHPNPQIAFAAARDILDRGGMKAPDLVNISGPDGGPIDTVMTVRFVKPDAA